MKQSGLTAQIITDMYNGTNKENTYSYAQLTP